MFDTVTGTLGIIMTAVSISFYLYVEKRANRRAKAVLKPFASLGFLILALSSGALQSGWGIVLLIGLTFCTAGDLFLLSRNRGPFSAGLASFLTGHLCYCAAIVMRGPAPVPVAVAAAALILPALFIWRWLRPHLAGGMRGPVAAYVVVISAMLALAIGAPGTGVSWRLIPGALAFYLSDIAVARDRFVAPGFGNRVWGLPLYYFGQLLIASCAG